MNPHGFSGAVRVVKNSEFISACREGGRAIENTLREPDRAFFSLLFREARRVIRDAEQDLLRRLNGAVDAR